MPNDFFFSGNKFWATFESAPKRCNARKQNLAEKRNLKLPQQLKVLIYLNSTFKELHLDRRGFESCADICHANTLKNPQTGINIT